MIGSKASSDLPIWGCRSIFLGGVYGGDHTLVDYGVIFVGVVVLRCLVGTVNVVDVVSGQCDWTLLCQAWVSPGHRGVGRWSSPLDSPRSPAFLSPSVQSRSQRCGEVVVPSWLPQVPSPPLSLGSVPVTEVWGGGRPLLAPPGPQPASLPRFSPVTEVRGGGRTLLAPPGPQPSSLPRFSPGHRGVGRWSSPLGSPRSPAFLSPSVQSRSQRCGEVVVPSWLPQVPSLPLSLGSVPVTEVWGGGRTLLAPPGPQPSSLPWFSPGHRGEGRWSYPLGSPRSPARLSPSVQSRSQRCGEVVVPSWLPQVPSPPLSLGSVPVTEVWGGGRTLLAPPGPQPASLPRFSPGHRGVGRWPSPLGSPRSPALLSPSVQSRSQRCGEVVVPSWLPQVPSLPLSLGSVLVTEVWGGGRTLLVPPGPQPSSLPRFSPGHRGVGRWPYPLGSPRSPARLSPSVQSRSQRCGEVVVPSWLPQVPSPPFPLGSVPVTEVWGGGRTLLAPPGPQPASLPRFSPGHRGVGRWSSPLGSPRSPARLSPSVQSRSQRCGEVVVPSWFPQAPSLLSPSVQSRSQRCGEVVVPSWLPQVPSPPLSLGSVPVTEVWGGGRTLLAPPGPQPASLPRFSPGHRGVGRWSSPLGSPRSPARLSPSVQSRSQRCGEVVVPSWLPQVPSPPLSLGSVPVTEVWGGGRPLLAPPGPQPASLPRFSPGHRGVGRWSYPLGSPRSPARLSPSVQSRSQRCGEVAVPSWFPQAPSLLSPSVQSRSQRCGEVVVPSWFPQAPSLLSPSVQSRSQRCGEVVVPSWLPQVPSPPLSLGSVPVTEVWGGGRTLLAPPGPQPSSPQPRVRYLRHAPPASLLPSTTTRTTGSVIAGIMICTIWNWCWIWEAASSWYGR